jgi:hypothetical protein
MTLEERTFDDVFLRSGPEVLRGMIGVEFTELFLRPGAAVGRSAFGGDVDVSGSETRSKSLRSISSCICGNLVSR